MTRAIRFGYQPHLDDGDDPVDVARRAEAAGFDVFLLPDHVGGGPAPLPALAAAASATSTIRLGTFVLNADMRNPVQLAWEATTIDRLSGGRFELGLGAGHTPHEYEATGIELKLPRDRKAALAERIEIVRRLLDGETVTHAGAHHRLHEAAVPRSLQDHLPILVGGNGAALLGHAGAHADIIGLQGLGRTQADGHRHSVKWEVAHLDRQVEQVCAGAGERIEQIELNALVQMVDVTDDAEQSLTNIAELIDDGMTATELAEIPYVLVGTVDEIADEVLRARDRWGITYFAVRSLDDFAPVIARLRELEA